MKKKILMIVLAVAVLITAVFAAVKLAGNEKNKDMSNSIDVSAVTTQSSLSLPYELSNGCEIAEIKSYDGPFVENGSDSEKKNVFAVVVKNTTGKHFQYVTLTLNIGGEDYNFEVTTLFDNSAVTVLEKSGKPFVNDKIETVNVDKSVEFGFEPTVHPNELEITVMDGLMNVKNISGKDIDGNIYIYYKISDGDDWFGGITYRASTNSGLKAGELRQIPANHFKKETCKVVFVEYAG
ncbi:MAG: hypothetical protein ACI4GY_01290 [Acutalibacteraceae bacterium]